MANMKLEGNKDSYEIDEVDCFEKPIGIVIEGMRPGYAGLFYMFLKFTQAYNVEHFFVDTPKNTIETEMKVKKQILREEFGVELQYKEWKETESFHNFMEKELSGTNVVLVPGSLKELFYSKYYRRRNWPHLFLIKSYDSENQLYYTLDSSQFFKENMNLYRDFVIPYDIMERLHATYKKDYFQYVYCIDSGKTEQMLDAGTIVGSCIHYFLKGKIEKQPYREIYYLEHMNQAIGSQEEVTYYSEKLLRTNKAKKVFLHELGRYLEMKEYAKEKLDEFQTCAEHVLKEWKKLTNICYVHARKGKCTDVREESKNAVLMEEALYEQIKELSGFVQNSVSEDTVRKGKKQLENNEEHVITIGQDNTYTFLLPKGKVYTSWFKDDSPKVVLKQISDYENSFYISCKVKINVMKECSNFHGGIFLRTDQGYVYFWGTHCGNLIRLDLGGIDTDLYTYEKAGEEVWIGVRLEKNSCRVEVLSNGEVEDFHDISLIGRVVEVGVGCKTWDESDEVALTFSQVRMEDR